MDNLKNLLNQVSIIQKKYDDIAEYSGEHYNVFDILGVTANELSHSAIITNMLDAKGKHGQKELFLKLFLNLLKDKFEESDCKMIIENFEVKNSFAVKEKYVGRVNFESEQGGKIDIVIYDKKNNIIIENKIYAVDQPKQLVRYNEHDKKAPILYLTLDGKEPSVDARGNLKPNIDYVCISYEVFIRDWLELCIKEMVNKPIIRETLNQYLFLIKSLTNQSNNYKMSEEIVKIIIENLEESQNIIENFEYAKIEIIQRFWERCCNKFKDIPSEWIVELKPAYYDSYNYILLHKKENNKAYFYCRHNLKSGGIFYGININKEIKNISPEAINKDLNTEYVPGAISVIWKPEENFNLNLFKDLIEINKNDGVFENIVFKNMKKFMGEHEEIYKLVLEKIENYLKEKV